MLFNSLKFCWNSELKIYHRYLFWSILILLVLFNSSCITTSQSCDCNEQVKIKKYKRYKKKHQLTFYEVIKQRDSLMLATKQVADDIEKEKKQTGFVSAIQLNKLYKIFGEQVQNDLFLESYLKKRKTTDSPIFFKQMYGAQLAIFPKWIITFDFLLLIHFIQTQESLLILFTIIILSIITILYPLI